MISVVIRVRNERANLRRCLARVRDQVLPRGQAVEVIVVDNESTDGSADVARAFGAEVVHISAEEFSWGRALNRGIAKARGEFVVVLSADACPADDRWLAEMLKPFAVPTVAATYGRQLPRADAPVEECSRLKERFGDQSLRFGPGTEGVSPTGAGMLTSNACAAIRRRLWESMPYDEEALGGEEGIWTYNVLARGHAVVYQASARVYHSHKDPILRHAWRLWELWGKNRRLSGQCTGWQDVFRFMGSMVKRRWRACLRAEAGLLRRAGGLVRLPLELGAFAVVSGIAANDGARRRLRPLLWG